MIEKNVSPRKPWLALLLSLAGTGLGQVYNGQWKKGVCCFLAELACAAGLVLAFATFKGLVSAFVVLFLINMAVAGDAFVHARRSNDYELKPYNRRWVYILLLVANLAAGATSNHVLGEHFFKTYVVPTGSMLPTVQRGDRFVVSILDKDDVLERGDIVVFKAPGNSGRDFVKRVIGLPGETVSMADRRVFINGSPLEEPYTVFSGQEGLPGRDDSGPIRLCPEEYFLMGDNRDKSYDSRFFGPVMREAIFARTLYLYFPANVGGDGWFDRLGSRLE